MSEISKGPTVVGIDVSLASTGIGVVIDSPQTGPGVKWETVPTTYRIPSSGQGKPVRNRVERLETIRNAIYNKIPILTHLVVIEAPGYALNEGKAHERAGLWWMIASALVDRGHVVIELSPTALKKYITGSGKANKDAMLVAMTKLYPNLTLNNDEADALGLALFGRALIGHPVLPETKYRADVLNNYVAANGLPA